MRGWSAPGAEWPEGGTCIGSHMLADVLENRMRKKGGKRHTAGAITYQTDVLLCCVRGPAFGPGRPASLHPK